MGRRGRWVAVPVLALKGGGHDEPFIRERALDDVGGWPPLPRCPLRPGRPSLVPALQRVQSASTA